MYTLLTIGVNYATEGDQKEVNAIFTAMKKSGTVVHTVVQGTFVGPARSGKNCLMERLLRRIPPRVSPSTGVADSVVQINCRTKQNYVISAVAHTDGSKWTAMDDDDQAVDYVRIASSKHVRCEKEFVHPTSPQEGVTTMVDGAHVIPDKSPTKSMHAMSSNSNSAAQSSVIITSTSDPCPNDNFGTSRTDIFAKAIKKKGLSSLESHTNHASLYLTNTGGQVEFQDVLPLLVSGPSVFFYTFRLDYDLNRPYEVVYEVSVQNKCKTYSYKSSGSIKDGILQTLASVASMVTYVYIGEKRKELKPKVFLVGTHKDLLDKRSTINCIDKELKEAIEPFELMEIVERASESQLIFALNNFSESDSAFHSIRLRVHDLMEREQYKMEFPKHWLEYSFALRQIQRKITNIAHCLDVAKRYNIETKEELKKALRFLHSATGLIRYFEFDDEEDIVVIHPQYLFDIVTELIVATFTFEKVTPLKMEKFKQRGIFSLSDFENISAKFAMFHPQEPITAQQFGKLLEKLRIAAPFMENNKKMYFLPCVLGHADIQEENAIPSEIPRLLVSFECGYCPKGVAGALITYLMTNEMQSSFHWNLLKKKIFRDQASFRVGPYDTLIIKNFAVYLEITCIPGNFGAGREYAVTETCSDVREAINAGVSKVLNDMNYVEVKYSFTFSCPRCTTPHPAKINYHNRRPCTLECDKMGLFELPPENNKWDLGNIVIPIINSFFDQLQVYATEWYLIGVQLNISPGELDIIETTYPDVLKRLRAMLVKWFEKTSTSNLQMLEDLKSALRSRLVGLNVAAESLQLP